LSDGALLTAVGLAFDWRGGKKDSRPGRAAPRAGLRAAGAALLFCRRAAAAAAAAAMVFIALFSITDKTDAAVEDQMFISLRYSR